MEKEIKKHNNNIKKIIVGIFLFLAICSFQFLNFKQTEVFASDGNEVYSSYSDLVYSYENFSYDYDGETLPSGYCMRDDYMIYAEQQSVMGLCWAFGSQKVLSTTLMKATGEYYDFSEAWIGTALTYGDKYNLLPNYDIITSTQYVIGEGGYFLGFDTVAKKYGLVLEQDFGYENVYNISLENSDKFYNLYHQYSSNNFRDNLLAGRFEPYLDSSNKIEIINSIKNHILIHGAVGTGMKFNSISESNSFIYKKPDSNAKVGHFVTLIGWDDKLSMTVNGKTYNGAWIGLNSYGNEIYNSFGDEGIIYIFYDDTDFVDYFWGYKYNKNTSQDVYYIDKVTDSNASYVTDLKGEYYGEYSGVNSKTKQKNIFYEQSNLMLEYTYEVSQDTTVDKVEIFKEELDVTNLFNININTNKINLAGSDLKTGAYKVVISYKKDTTTKKHINSFYVCDGTEVNYVICCDYDKYEMTNNIPNSGFYQIYNSYDIEDEEIIYTTEGVSNMYIKFTFASYHNIVQNKFNGYNYGTTNLNKNIFAIKESVDPSVKTDYYFEFITATGISKKLKVKVIDISTSSQILASIYYSVDGADNSSNSRKVALTTNGSTIINKPIKEGYVFKGWYYSSDFSSSSLLKYENDEYYLEYNKVNKELSPTISESFSEYFGYYYKRFYNVLLYAKFEEEIAIVTFDTDGGTSIASVEVSKGEKISQPSSPTKTGYDFIGWYKEDSFKNLWNFESDVVNASITLYAKYILKQASASLTSTSSSQKTLKDFSLIINFSHDLASSAKFNVVWTRDDQIIANTTTLSYVENVNIAKTYQYIAEITYTIDGYTTTIYTNTLNVSVTSSLREINTVYEGHNIFSINDPDSYNSNYVIKIYCNGSYITTLNTTEKFINISQFITNSGSYYIAVQKSYNGDILEYVNSDIAKIVSYKVDMQETIYVDYGTTLSNLEQGTKSGYTFKEWQVNNSKITFPYTITNDVEITSIWILEPISSASISAVKLIYEVEENFDITLNYTHTLTADDLKVKLYVNNEYLQTFNSNTISITFNEVGTKNIYAVVYFTKGNQTVEKTTDTIELIIKESLKAILIDYAGNGVFNIDDPNTFTSSYQYTLYFNNLNVYQNTTTEKTINVSSEINTNQDGDYYLSIIKSYDGESLPHTNSEVISIYKISYNGLDDYTNYPTQLVDKESILNQPTNFPTKNGYDFVGWLGNNNLLIFPVTVQSNIDLKPKWKLKNINVSNIEDINFVYDKNERTITLSVTHELAGGEYKFSWEKDGEQITTEKDLVIKNVNQSGNYKCNIYYYVDGDMINASTNLFEVKINKAQTNLDFTELKNKVFTYNGNIQTINSGAKVVRTDEIPEIIYSNNTFKDVPKNNILKVQVTAVETDNYLSVTEYADITINKSISTLSAESEQTYNYCSEIIHPNYTLNNNEQIVEYSKLPINVGTYENILIKAQESTNYLESQIYVTIKINPAKITITIDNKESILNADLKDFTYTITSGTLYEGDSLYEMYLSEANKSKAGKTIINMIVNNKNYDVKIIAGTYTVTETPNIIGAVAIGGMTLTGIAFISFKIATKKKLITKITTGITQTVKSNLNIQKSPNISSAREKPKSNVVTPKVSQKSVEDSFKKTKPPIRMTKPDGAGQTVQPKPVTPPKPIIQRPATPSKLTTSTRPTLPQKPVTTQKPVTQKPTISQKPAIPPKPPVNKPMPPRPPKT